ncbi:hypothetical protein AGOR_G00142120 [Albula goreensis]|uniref:Zinc finger DNA-directed DNA polymerase family B alpha domain-containing protein n=1 Tax=Albula goreensis TaxID=1534307 RepID=A0A8T3D6P8_9TELE|nr:hypothetical protein AGOR_G00142120 [Albula goreensis]
MVLTQQGIMGQQLSELADVLGGYSEKALYNQLSFYRFIFDWDYAFNKVLQHPERVKVKGFQVQKEAYRKLKDIADRVLATSSYSEVNLSKLFQVFTSLK